MCVQSSFIWVPRGNSYEKVNKPCNDCWSCRQNKINDFTGRALCEQAQSDWVMYLTCTYAPRDDGWDKSVNKEHWQKFVRALRRRGLKVRYLVAGEHAPETGRAHFHAILFGKGTKPRCWTHHSRIGEPALEIPNKKRAWWPEWPHGHIFTVTNVVERQLRYVAKYVMKEGQEDWFSMSKKPALGFEFFKRKAIREANSNIWPSTMHYQPPAGSKQRDYLLTGAMRRDYLAMLHFYHGKPFSVTFRERELRKRSEWVAKCIISDAKKVARRAYDVLVDMEQVSPWEPQLDQESYLIQQAEAKIGWHGVAVEIGEINGKEVVYLPQKPNVLLHPQGSRWTEEEQRALSQLFHALFAVRHLQGKWKTNSKDGRLIVHATAISFEQWTRLRRQPLSKRGRKLVFQTMLKYSTQVAPISWMRPKAVASRALRATDQHEVAWQKA